MHYYIDGYNLLFRTVRAADDGDLRTQREKVIVELAAKINIAALDATLVFDSQFKAGPGEILCLESLDIHFTDEGVTADDYIIDSLRRAEHPRSITVVTSDGRLAWRARRKMAQSMPVEEFLALLNRIYRKKKRLEAEPIPKVVVEVAPVKKKRLTADEKYAAIFEEKLKAAEPMARIPLPEGSDRPQKKHVRIDKPDDMERWLREFEKRLIDPSEEK